MANQKPSDRNNGGGDVTKAEKVSVEPIGNTTDWTVYNQKGEETSDKAYE